FWSVWRLSTGKSLASGTSDLTRSIGRVLLTAGGAVSIDLKGMADDLELLVFDGQRNDSRYRAGVDAEAPAALKADDVMVVGFALKLEQRDPFILKIDLVDHAGIS